jgi:hypothetical protein
MEAVAGRRWVSLRSTHPAECLRSVAGSVRYFFLDGISKRAYVRSVPLTEGVSGDEPESERDAASCVHGS